jgi:hypothetical protein
MSRVITLVAGESRNLSQEIERHLSVRTGDPLVLIEGHDFVLVKKAASVDPVERFDDLAARTRARFERLDVGPDDMDGAIAWARGSS